MGARSVLLVDVGTPLCGSLRRESERLGLSLLQVGGGAVVGGEHALCVIELDASDPAERQRLRVLRKSLRTTPVFVLARDVDVDAAVACMRLGADDLVAMPGGGSAADDAAARALALARPDDDAVGDPLVGRNRAIVELRGAIAAAARVDSTVLLQGETGTGKGLVARLVHERSRRASGAFVHVDCAALSPALIESELFGHERGAFTGATALRRGRFELASAGTIFLDEIGDLDEHLQTKLLRVLEDRRYERVGGSRTQVMQARVIAATSRQLLERVRGGYFRQDLYFRLNVIPLSIPPLRERLDDLPLLVEAGLSRLCARLELPRPSVSPALYDALMAHRWPGNVRELMNALERMLVCTRADVLEPGDLPELIDAAVPPAPPAAAPPPPGAEERDEPARIRRVLDETGGNVARAARRLGMARGTLRYRIRKLGLQDAIPRD